MVERLDSNSQLFPEPKHVGRPNIGDRKAFLAEVEAILDRQWLSNDGPVLQQFEAALADRLGGPHVVATANGTVGLELVVKTLGLHEGRVVMPSYTFAATAHAVSWQGGTPLFVDIDSASHCLAPDSVEAAMNDAVAGILAVHLWGGVADVHALEQIAARHGVPLVLDAAHAYAVKYGDGRPVGLRGAAEVFSFHATKFFNTLEGGAVSTMDGSLAEELRLRRNFGFRGVDDVAVVGTNAKMNEICAAAGLVNMRFIDMFIQRNREVVQAYTASLADSPLSVWEPSADVESNYQYVVVDCGELKIRDRLVESLRDANVLARRYFWPGLHRMEAYKELPASQDLTRTNDVADRHLVLPGGSSVNVNEASMIGARLVELTAS